MSDLIDSRSNTRADVKVDENAEFIARQCAALCGNCSPARSSLSEQNFEITNCDLKKKSR
jgi:hypothetical protein